MDSHFIGKAVYRRLNEPSLLNPHPIVISADGPRQSSNQVRDYVFCYDCEQIFNQKGESWVHGQIATTAGFPMLEPLRRYTPIFLEPDMGLYDASAILEWDCEALLHYGAGVFFKAGVHDWPTEGGETKIDLGPYLEPLRNFVLGQGGFPDKYMNLALSIAGSAKPFLGCLPPVRVHDPETHKYQYYVCGLMYTLMVGKTIPRHMNKVSLAWKTPTVVFVRDVSTQAIEMMKKMSPDPDELLRALKTIDTRLERKSASEAKIKNRHDRDIVGKGPG